MICVADARSAPRGFSSPKTIVPRQRVETSSPLLPNGLYCKAIPYSNERSEIPDPRLRSPFEITLPSYRSGS